jgi:hypothetical protein
MVDTKAKWEDELGRWPEPFLDRLGHKCPLYISGLIGPGDRKSVQPMSGRLAPGDYDQLHHFIAEGSRTQRRWKQNCSFRPTGSSAAKIQCWSSTTHRCRRRAIARLV